MENIDRILVIAPTNDYHDFLLWNGGDTNPWFYWVKDCIVVEAY